MRFVPKGNVRVQLTLTILLVILLSWLISTIMSNYLILQNMRSLRQTMLQHPDLYPRPLPEQHIGLRELLMGPAEYIAFRPAQPRPPRVNPRTEPSSPLPDFSGDSDVSGSPAGITGGSRPPAPDERSDAGPPAGGMSQAANRRRTMSISNRGPSDRRPLHPSSIYIVS